MAIENVTVMLGIGFVVNYFLLYKRNQFFGGIIYFLLSLGILYYGGTLTAGADKNITIIVGVLLMIGTLISVIYDIALRTGIISYRVKR